MLRALNGCAYLIEFAMVPTVTPTHGSNPSVDGNGDTLSHATLCVEVGYNAGLSRRRPRVQVPSTPPPNARTRVPEIPGGLL